jgi:hypothetical protein
MGQLELYNFLAEQRKDGNDSFFTVKEVIAQTHCNPFSAFRSVNQLYASGFLEIKLNVDSKKPWIRERVFRATNNFLENGVSTAHAKKQNEHCITK